MKYFICGFSGAGKTTLLSKIKDSGEYPDYIFVDLDEWIFSQNPGQESLGDLIESRGWEWFRKTETEELMNLLKSPNIWIALGGGTLTEELVEKINKLEDVKGYWIDTDFETCWERIENDKNRPLVNKGRDVLKNLYNERYIVYQLFERLLV